MKKTNPLPSQEFLLAVLRYDAETGRLFWRERDASTFEHTPGRSSEHKARIFNVAHAGKEAFTCTDSEGRREGRINRILFKAHRVIFKMLHNEEPPEVDHDDRDPGNNRAGNLKASNSSMNNRNKGRSSRNTSGHNGVHLNQNGKWSAHIQVAGKSKYLGSFDDKSFASSVRKQADHSNGFSMNHGESK